MKLQPTASQAKILKQIFIGYEMVENEFSMQLWIDDLVKYDAKTITEAWHEWRDNEKRNPKPWDIAKIAKRLKYIEESKKIGEYVHSAKTVEQYKRGRSEIEDAMLDAQERANRNNPNLLRDIRNANGPYEKMAICALAQGISVNKINAILAPLFKRWKESEQKELIEYRNTQNVSQ